MKFIKLIMLFCIGAFFVASNAIGQVNPTISVIGQGTTNPMNVGEVPLGGTLDLLIVVGNTGSANITAYRLRPVITVPALVTILPDAQQTGLPAGWSILSNAGGIIRLCSGTDVIAPSASRSIIIKVQGANIGGPSTFSGQLTYGGTTSCAASGSASGGNNTADDNSQSTVTVVAASCTLAATATAGTIACNGGTTTLTAATTGATGAVEYSITGGAPFQTLNTFTVSAGTYTVTAREVANTSCSNTATPVVISQPTLLVAASSATPILCNGGNSTVTVSATGGTAPYTGTGTFTRTSGAYSYTVTDANGCTSTTSGTITQPTVLVAASSATAILCNGGNSTVTVSATGGTAPYTGTGTFTRTSGAYSYTVTDANGCTSTTSGTITQPTVLVAASSATAILCNGGNSTVTVSATGGTAPYTGTGTFTRTAGAYTYTVTDANGCTSVTTGTIAQPTALVTAATSTAILCNGGNSTVVVSATGGTAPYTGTGTFTRTVGAYSYTVTDANGCTNTVSGTISQPAVLAVSATFAPITVFGGSTTVNVSATGGTAPYTGTGAFVRADGTFTFTVTDANGCSGSSTITIAPFSTPVTADPAVGQMNFTTIANAAQSANSLLFTQDYRLRIPFYNLSQTDDVPNGTISLRVNLGSKLSLATGFNLATAPLSTYFTFTSAVVADSVIITGTQIAAIPADFASTLIFNVKGRLSCTANVSTRISVVNLAALLIDEDLNNNAATIQYTLPVTVTTTQVNVTCNGAANGIINVTSSPGTTVVIRNSSNVVVTNTGLAPGVYTVTATAVGDAPLSNTCSNFTTVTIVQPAVLTAASSTTVNNVCNAGTDGVITATSLGGTTPYTYVILTGTTINTTGATSGIFTGLAAGTYTIRTTDANGCIATTSATVTQPTGTAPNISLGSDITSSFFNASGVTQTIVYNVSEIAGNPAVGDTIRITRVTGFTINLNTAIFSTVVSGTTYTLDNSRWKIDNTDPSFVSIILTNPVGPGPGTLLCNQRVNVAVTLTRNTTDVSTFTLSARLRRANGELILSNNLNSIIMTAE